MTTNTTPPRQDEERREADVQGLTDEQCARQLALMKTPPMKDGAALNDWACDVMRAGHRLAALATARPAAVGLTDEQIDRLHDGIESEHLDRMTGAEIRALFRAIERALAIPSAATAPAATAVRGEDAPGERFAKMPSTFDRRWKLAVDWFDLQRDDQDGSYVHIDDALDVLQHYAGRLLEMQNAAVALAATPGERSEAREDTQS